MTLIVRHQLSSVIHEKNAPLLANKEGVVIMMFNDTHYNLVVQNVWSDWLISKQLCRHLIA